MTNNYFRAMPTYNIKCPPNVKASFISFTLQITYLYLQLKNEYEMADQNVLIFTLTFTVLNNVEHCTFGGKAPNR